VLNAFHLVNEGLQSSNGSLTSKNDDIYRAFEKQMQDNPQKQKIITTELKKPKHWLKFLMIRWLLIK